tara:strand:+ start:2301 stop:2885 length:585 start_codon:yes stop_codon:yes gene_type:complete
MKQLKKILIIIPFFIVSCTSVKYIKDYEPINVFLETQKIDKNKKHILQIDKAPNKQTLRIFNRKEGAEHIADPTDTIDYTDGLFVEKHWKKMYKTYAKDTIKKYWAKEDFPAYDFILEDGKGLFKYDFEMRHLGARFQEATIISEPIYYMNREYIMFYYSKLYSIGGGKSSTVIMKREKEKWIVVRIIGDYVYY